MSSAAITALRARIATNTLTTADQGALTTALDFIAPSFGQPDETSALVFSDEENAREWMAALYTIQAGGSPLVVPGKVITPNSPPTSLTFTPGVSPGHILAVIDITPTETGLVLVSGNFEIQPASTDTPVIEIALVEDLTAVTGGTLVSPGLTTGPTSITPAVSGGTAIYAAEKNSEVTPPGGGGTPTAGIVFASVPVQLTVGHRAAIAFVAVSLGAIAWTVEMSISAIEQPAL